MDTVLIIGTKLVSNDGIQETAYCLVKRPANNLATCQR